jgi:hypothetical protein
LTERIVYGRFRRARADSVPNPKGLKLVASPHLVAPDDGGEFFAGSWLMQLADRSSLDDTFFASE